ncbi:hypothetical protein F989_00384 [Acinetobacter parvus NIPH 1103]|uniref:Uncharacterized protein n=1 Tax=Acinetobacter parvus NIPH 1103 TaxID=1217671 RepID=N8Q7X8_9GAMM|nr:hypothetical protein F989_00384 [Acinetobacter parvus NIPH 1103]
MPKRIIHTTGAQQFTPPTILASLIHYAEQQHWDYLTWFKDSGLDIGQIQQTNGAVRFTQMFEENRSGFVGESIF